MFEEPFDTPDTPLILTAPLVNIAKLTNFQFVSPGEDWSVSRERFDAEQQV